jgi:hypothetical protein
MFRIIRYNGNYLKSEYISDDPAMGHIRSFIKKVTIRSFKGNRLNGRTWYPLRKRIKMLYSD